jgi:hypothetical protein
MEINNNELIIRFSQHTRTQAYMHVYLFRIYLIVKVKDINYRSRINERANE